MTSKEFGPRPGDLGGIPIWKRFLQRDDAGGRGFTAPDGNFFHLASDEELTFSEPKPGNERDVLIKKGDKIIPFEIYRQGYKNPNEK